MLRLSRVTNRLSAGRVKSPIFTPNFTSALNSSHIHSRNFYCSPYARNESKEKEKSTSNIFNTSSDKFKEPPKYVNFLGYDIDVKSYKDFMSENLGLADSVLADYLKTMSKKSSDNLVRGLPREIPGFFSEYANEILNFVTKDLPKDAYKELYQKEQISKKINQIVLGVLNEMLVDMREISNKDFSRLKY